VAYEILSNISLFVGRYNFVLKTARQVHSSEVIEVQPQAGKLIGRK